MADTTLPFDPSRKPRNLYRNSNFRRYLRQRSYAILAGQRRAQGDEAGAAKYEAMADAALTAPLRSFELQTLAYLEQAAFGRTRNG